MERLKLSSSTTPVATATSVGVIYKNTLKRLNLSCNLLGNDGCEVFVDALKEEIGLRGRRLGWGFRRVPYLLSSPPPFSNTALDLQSNSINDAGGRMIEQMLRINTDLVIVDLRNNSLGNHSFFKKK